MGGMATRRPLGRATRGAGGGTAAGGPVRQAAINPLTASITISNVVRIGWQFDDLLGALDEGRILVVHDPVTHGHDVNATRGFAALAVALVREDEAGAAGECRAGAGAIPAVGPKVHPVYLLRRCKNRVDAGAEVGDCQRHRVKAGWVASTSLCCCSA